MEVDLIEVDTAGFDYENLEDWFVSLKEFERKSWSTLLSKNDFTLDESDKIFNTAIIIYCKEMAINSIPRKDVFINEIINTFVINFSLLKMRQIGLIDNESKLNMIDVDRNIKLTEKGKEVGDILLKENGEKSGLQHE